MDRELLDYFEQPDKLTLVAEVGGEAVKIEVLDPLAIWEFDLEEVDGQPTLMTLAIALDPDNGVKVERGQQ